MVCRTRFRNSRQGGTSACLRSIRSFATAGRCSAKWWVTNGPRGSRLSVSIIQRAIRSELNQIFIIILKSQRFETYTLLHLENQDGDPKPRPFNVAYTKTFGKPHWFDTVQREYWACRESVGLADYSSFTKIDLKVSSISGNNQYGY